jgi:maleate isomerase
MTGYRVGLVVPSSNVTMETEIPELLHRQWEATGTRFTFHSSRVRMRHVEPAELAAMNALGGRAAEELADADCDVIAYACLVAAMVEPGGHVKVEADLRRAVQGADPSIPILSSAGALIEAIGALGASCVALIAPYLEPLTEQVIAYLALAGITVVDSTSLCVADNLAVAKLDPDRLPQLARQLDRSGADAIVLSACVQMPSLAAVDLVERELGLPVLSAATATTWKILDQLGVPPQIPGAGRLLAGPGPGGAGSGLRQPATLGLNRE